MRRARLLPFAFAFVVGAAAPAAAQPAAPTIAEARERWFEAEFEASLAGFEAILEAPDLSPGDALEAHRYLAALCQILGDEEPARVHADAAVALDPSIEPPDGAPPQARDLFLMARRRIGGREATIVVEAPEPLVLEEPGRVVARVDPAPPALFADLRLRCGAASREGAPPSVELSVTPEGDLTCIAEARTASGAVLRTTHRTFDLATAGAPVAETRGRRAWPWVVAASVVAAAAVGTTVGVVVARNGRDPELASTTVVGW